MRLRSRVPLRTALEARSGLVSSKPRPRPKLRRWPAMLSRPLSGEVHRAGNDLQIRRLGIRFQEQGVEETVGEGRGVSDRGLRDVRGRPLRHGYHAPVALRLLRSRQARGPGGGARKASCEFVPHPARDDRSPPAVPRQRRRQSPCRTFRTVPGDRFLLKAAGP